MFYSSLYIQCQVFARYLVNIHLKNEPPGNKCEKLLSRKEMQMKSCLAYHFPLAKLANT